MNDSEVETLNDEYYRTYADEFNADIVIDDDSYFNDYNQLCTLDNF